MKKKTQRMKTTKENAKWNTSAGELRKKIHKENPIPVLFTQNFYLLSSKSSVAF